MLTEQRFRKYVAWLGREPVHRPMIGLLWEPDIPPLPAFLQRIGAGAEVHPDQIRPEVFLPYIEHCYQQASGLAGDVIQRFTPAFGIPWMEAIAGCRVRAKPGSLWAESALASLTDRSAIGFHPDNPWLCGLINFTIAMVHLADGRFPVAVPQLRGPLDTLAAMRTPEQMCLDLLEQPDEAFVVLGELTELWIAVGQAVLDVIPPFHDGYVARMGTWAPGPILTAQNDVSTMISPGLYEQLVLPWDRRIVEHFPYMEFHLHSTEHHQVKNLLKLDRLTTIEFTLEHTLGGPSLEVTLPVVRRILAHKPLILAALDCDTADRCLNELPHQGLCLTIAVSGSDVPAAVRRWLESRCRK